MTPEQLTTEVIRPVLNGMGLWSQAAEDLMIGTAIHESDGLKRVRQYGGGPALSYYQMEPATLYDLYDHYLKYHPDKKALLEKYQIKSLNLSQNLTMNMAFATAATRLQYYRVREVLPGTLEGQAKYWKKYWNTEKGKGTVQDYITHYKRYYQRKNL